MGRIKKEYAEEREHLGSDLSKLRSLADLSKSEVMIKGEWTTRTRINELEKGSKNYTIDSLLRYCAVIGAELHIVSRKTSK